MAFAPAGRNQNRDRNPILRITTDSDGEERELSGKWTDFRLDRQIQRAAKLAGGKRGVKAAGWKNGMLVI